MIVLLDQYQIVLLDQYQRHRAIVLYVLPEARSCLWLLERVVLYEVVDME